MKDLNELVVSIIVASLMNYLNLVRLGSNDFLVVTSSGYCVV